MPSKIRLYFSKELKANLLSNLYNEQSHYIKNVMRLKPGDTISLFNSRNGEWSAKIVNHDKKNSEFKVDKLIKSKTVFLGIINEVKFKGLLISKLLEDSL